MGGERVTPFKGLKKVRELVFPPIRRAKTEKKEGISFECLRSLLPKPLSKFQLKTP